MPSNTKEYLTVQELEQDLLTVTGNPSIAKNQATQYAIYYRGEIIDSARYKKGLISKDDLILSRHVRCEHNKRHSIKLSRNMIAAGRERGENMAAHHIVAWDEPRASKARLWNRY